VKLCYKSGNKSSLHNCDQYMSDDECQMSNSFARSVVFTVVVTKITVSSVCLETQVL